MLGELNEKEIQEILKNNSIARIGCTDGTEVYVVPINYHYEQHAVRCYSIEGLKINMMRKHPSVCLQVDEIKDSNNWKCIVINGTFEEITDEKELSDLRPHYTEYLLRQRASLPDKQGSATEDHSKPAQVFYRIRFNKVSGRFEHND